jgi:hypothetical protein
MTRKMTRDRLPHQPSQLAKRRAMNTLIAASDAEDGMPQEFTGEYYNFNRERRQFLILAVTDPEQIRTIKAALAGVTNDVRVVECYEGRLLR